MLAHRLYATTVILGLAGLTAPALAQNNQETTPTTIGGDTIQKTNTTGDSGTGSKDDAQAWIGSKVVTSDGKEVGTLKDIQSVSDTSDSGSLLVEPSEGGELVDVPMQGATFSDGTVTVTPTSQSLQNAN